MIMRKLISRISIFILSLVLTFTLIGCDGCNTETPPPPNTDVQNPDNSGTPDNPSNPNPDVPSGPNTDVYQPEAPSITMLESKGLLLGETFILSATAKNCEEELVWVTSDPSIVTVNGGVLNAVGVGQAEITVSSGTAFAKCAITVGYGEYFPELLTYSGIENDGAVLSLGSTYTIKPYVKFNGKEFNDAVVSYSSDNTSIATVDASGVITAVGNGVANVTVSASWRDFTDSYLLSKTFEVSVKDNVLFMINGEISGGFNIKTPANFIDSSEHENVARFVPTVVVNNGEPIEVTDVTIDAIGEIVEGVDYTIEKQGSEYVYTAYTLGDSLVTLKYQLGDDVHETNFYISATRPVKVIAETVEYFNLKRGTIKVNNGGEMVTSTLLKEYWEDGASLYDAYDANGNLLPFTENGEVYNVIDTNLNAIGQTTLKLGTKTEIYEFTLNTAGHFMFDAGDVVEALTVNPFKAGKKDTGYFPVMNDIDMGGAIVNAHSTGGFTGIFNGNGYTISNLVTDTTTQTINGVEVRGGGLFDNLYGTIKNVAFVNLRGIQNSGRSYVGLIGREFNGGSIENVYIDINPDTAPKGIGLFYYIGSAGIVTIKNTVINYPGPDGYVWNEREYVDNCESSGWVACRGVLGGGLVSYSQSGNMFKVQANADMRNVIVLSPMPLYHATPATKPEGYDSKVDSTDSFVYAENETKLWWQHSYLDEFYPDHEGEHTVESAGEWTGNSYQFKVNKRVMVLRGVRRYDNFSQLVQDQSEQMQETVSALADPGYFIFVDGKPIWYDLVDNYTSVTVNGNVAEEINLDCYSDAQISVVSGAQTAESVSLYEESDVISIVDNKIVAEKVGSGVLTVNYVWGGKNYSKEMIVNVLNPFKFYIDGNKVDETFEKVLGETASLSVKIGDTVVDGVTYSTVSDGISISGSTLSINKVVEGAVVKANFTYREVNYEISFVFNTIDPVSVETIVTINGSDVTEKGLLAISSESTIALKLQGKTPTITSIEVTSDIFSVNGDKVTAVAFGSADMIIIYNVDGVSHKKVIPVETSYQTVSVTDEVDYDAYEGDLKFSYEGKILEAKVYYNGNEIYLTEENGGVNLGRIYSQKAKKGDAQLGVPYIVYGDDTTMSMVIYTTKKVYEISNVSYYTSIINNAEEYLQAFDYGKYDATAHLAYLEASSVAENLRTPEQAEAVKYFENKYAQNNGIYVLGNNVDLTGTTIYNAIGGMNAPHWASIPMVVKEAGFTGAFDGRGYTVYNAKVDLNCLYTIGTGYPVICSTGLFPSIKSTAVIKNVAYVNVNAITNVLNDRSTWTGLFTDKLDGTVENVYFDVSPMATTANAGFAVEIDGRMKNVLINYPLEFDYETASSVRTMRSLYNHLGVGSLAGYLADSKGSVENVYIVSKMPINYYSYNFTDNPVTDLPDLNKDYFYYAENETELWYNHTVNGGKTFAEVIGADENKGKARRFAGVRRYNSAELIGADANANVEAFTNTGMFKKIENQLVWHDHKIVAMIDEAVNYEASTGVLSTTELPSDINYVSVNGETLTVENGGLIKEGNSYKLRAKTSADDTLAGVPYIVNGQTQQIQIVVDSDNKTYNFANVIYWNDILTTAEDVDTYFNLGTYNPETNALVNNNKYLALGNNIDMSTMGADYVIRNNHRYSATGNSSDWQFMYKFEGVLDGQGYAIENATVSVAALEFGGFNHSGGFFGLVSAATIKDIAFINYKAHVGTGESTTAYGGSLIYELQNKALVENVYVDLNKDSVPSIPVIYNAAWNKGIVNNFVINEPCADGWAWNDDVYASVSVGGWVMGYLVTSTSNNITADNIYVISPRPLGYVRPSSKPESGAHLANGWGDNDSLTTDYFVYGVNETKLWFTHSILDTLDPDNAGNHTVQSVVANNASGKARVVNNVRRYDNAQALASDASAENLAGIEKLTSTGYFTYDNGVIGWASV